MRRYFESIAVRVLWNTACYMYVFYSCRIAYFRLKSKHAFMALFAEADDIIHSVNFAQRAPDCLLAHYNQSHSSVNLERTTLDTLQMLSFLFVLFHKDTIYEHCSATANNLFIDCSSTCAL